MCVHLIKVYLGSSSISFACVWCTIYLEDCNTPVNRLPAALTVVWKFLITECQKHLQAVSELCISLQCCIATKMSL